MESSLSQRAALFSTVVLLHGLILWVALRVVTQPAVIQPEPPVLMASLITPETPKPEPPKPIPPQSQVKQQPQPIPVATTPVQAPAEHKIVEPTPKPVVPVVEPVPTPVPTPVVAPVVHTPPPPPAPVVAKPAPPEPETAPIFNADYLNNPEPAYPAKAQRLYQQGLVLLRVHVSSEGAALEVLLHKSSGFSSLDDAAINAVRKWRFVPAKRGKEAIAAWVQVPINFKL